MKKEFFFLGLFLNCIIFSQAQGNQELEFGVKEVSKIDINIQENGLAQVKENLILSQTTARIIIPKLSNEFSVIDSHGNKLGYELNEKEGQPTLTIYLRSPQEKSVNLSYITPSLTIKNASKWTFKFSSLVTPRITIININFPFNSNVTSLRSNDTFYVYPPRLSPSLYLYPQTEKISFEADYLFYPQQFPSSNLNSNSSFYLLGLVILFLSLLFFYFRKRREETTEEKRQKDLQKENKKEINPSVTKMLDETEKKIVEILLEKSSEGEITQAYLYKTLNIPKSSLSEVIRRLEQRNIIKKKKEGRINWIKLKNWVFK